MTTAVLMRALAAGWVGGFAGNALLGTIFSSSWVKGILYDPTLQSQVFVSLTPQRNIAVSVSGLIVLSGIHGLLFMLLRPSIPGRTWFGKGVAWGLMIWATYWLFQEWFIYITLLAEPIALAALELVILLSGSLVEGLVISRLVSGNNRGTS